MNVNREGIGNEQVATEMGSVYFAKQLNHTVYNSILLQTWLRFTWTSSLKLHILEQIQINYIYSIEQ